METAVCLVWISGDFTSKRFLLYSSFGCVYSRIWSRTSYYKSWQSIFPVFSTSLKNRVREQLLLIIENIALRPLWSQISHRLTGWLIELKAPYTRFFSALKIFESACWLPRSLTPPVGLLNFYNWQRADLFGQSDICENSTWDRLLQQSPITGKAGLHSARICVFLQTSGTAPRKWFCKKI